MTCTQAIPTTVIGRDRARTVIEGRYNVVWVDGECDASNKAVLVDVLARASELDEVDILVDLSGVAFMDASTIGTLIGARNHLRTRSLSLEIRAPSPAATRVLEICKLTGLVRVEARSGSL